MNASSWSLRNLPWFRATLAQWRYALRNTIAMCLALTIAYYLNLDEPYLMRRAINASYFVR